MIWKYVRKTHKNGHVICRMQNVAINAMVLVGISQLHFTQATHQSSGKQKDLISMGGNGVPHCVTMLKKIKT